MPQSRIDLIHQPITNNNMTPEMKQYLDERFDRIERMLEKSPKRRGQAATLIDQVETVEALFWKIVNTPKKTRVDVYHTPGYLIESIVQNHTEAVVFSVLVNQAALRKAFKPTSAADPSAKDAAVNAVKKSNLFVLPVRDTLFSSEGPTQIVMSPGEALRSVSDASLLPAVWRGWTFQGERGVTRKAHDGTTELEPAFDPSNKRDWRGASVIPSVDVEEPDVESPPAPEPAKPRPATRVKFL